ncbi:hypothetical protein P7L75_22530 [Tistrella mobilis]
MAMHKRFGLISFQLLRILRIAPEIACLKQCPVNAIQISKITKKLGRLQIGMTIREQKIYAR